MAFPKVEGNVFSKLIMFFKSYISIKISLTGVIMVNVFENKLVLLFYVDDIIIFGRTKKDLEFGVDLLIEYFNLKVLGKTKKLFSTEFEETDDKMHIHHNHTDKVCSL